MARTHGLVSCYQAGCRCDDCRRAARLYRQKYRPPSMRGTVRHHEPRLCVFCGVTFYRLHDHERLCAQS